jgi:hypothetical protein
MPRYSTWGRTEMGRLSQAVEKQTLSGMHINWKEVAEFVGNGRTPRMCRGKWEWELGGKGGPKKRWNDDENQLLWRLRHEEYEPWKVICPTLGRGVNDCRSHYKTLLKYYNRPKVTLKEPIFTENPLEEKNDAISDDQEWHFEWENDSFENDEWNF